ncbi:DUF1559 domain-containing protein [soil metagenome]
MSRFPRTRTRRYIKGFTMVELLVVVAIIGTLASLVISSYGGVMRKAKETKCVSNLRQVASGLMLYVGENNGRLPSATIDKDDPDAPINPVTGLKITADYMWSKQLGPYLPQKSDSLTSAQNKVFVCPAASYQGYANSAISTTYNSSSTLFYFSNSSTLGTASALEGRRMSTVQYPAKTILVAEGKLAVGATSPACSSSVRWDQAAADLGQAAPADTIYLDYRHGNKMNVVYGDGHVGSLFFKDRADITRSMWEGRNYTN